MEIDISATSADGALSLVISEPTGSGKPGTTLYELEAPSDLSGWVFFSAPEDAYLLPNTSYLVRIDITSGSVTIDFTNSTDESDLGLPGWSVADHIWSSSGPGQGLSWTSIGTNLYAITVRGSETVDNYGDSSFTAGFVRFSRRTGESPTVQGVVNDGTDVDWFETSLDFDYGGRYRIDVDPSGLTYADDIGVRAFYLDNPHHSSGVVELELESVTDPPEGYYSWHFVAPNNFGPYIEVSTDNGTVGAYAIRVAYDPDRTWTGTEIARGDLPHDDTTWATIEVDGEVADLGVYHYYEDHDWFAVDLEEDTSYLFMAIATGHYNDYMNPAIKLYDNAGNELESDYISFEDSTSTSVSINYEVPTGEGGTYYLDVTNAQLWDDPVKMGIVGITEPLVLFSPFLATRYYLIASTVNNDMRSLRSVPANADPRILNRRPVSLVERSGLEEHIAAFDSDSEDSITGYEIRGGADQDLFAISNAGVLSMTIVPDFDVPSDANMDNVYEVQVGVTSGSGARERSTIADFTITVTDDDTELETVLVSNTGRRNDGSATVNNSDSALRIPTGGNPDGYVIQSVALRFWEALENPTGVRVSLWSSHTPRENARPNSEVFAFTNPSGIGARLTEFTAPPETVLEADTSYWIMIERTGETAVKFLETRAESEDSISAAGWVIGSLRFYRPRNMDGHWTNRKVKSDGDQLKLRVIGYPVNAD